MVDLVWGANTKGKADPLRLGTMKDLPGSARC